MPTRKAKQTGRKKSLGRKTVRSSNRKRAALANQSDKVIPGRRRQAEPAVIEDESEKEIFGVLMSERARKGENIPRVPPAKVRNTRSSEPKNVPQTGLAKRRKRT
jgi:hypothetical protein